MLYRLTLHAMRRMKQRRVSPLHVSMALCEKPTCRRDGAAVYYLPRKRVKVVTMNGCIVTVVKAGVPDANV